VTEGNVTGVARFGGGIMLKRVATNSRGLEYVDKILRAASHGEMRKSPMEVQQ